jgi:hypothetical protein
MDDGTSGQGAVGRCDSGVGLPAPGTGNYGGPNRGLPVMSRSGTLVRIREVQASLGVAVNLEHACRESLRGPHVLANWIRRRRGMNVAGQPPQELVLAGHDSWA